MNKPDLGFIGSELLLSLITTSSLSRQLTKLTLGSAVGELLFLTLVKSAERACLAFIGCE